MLFVIDLALRGNCFSFFVTHRRSIVERGGCFQWRLFVCQFVRLFVNMTTSERLNVG